jgi:general secretion pathway protein K
MRRQEGIALVLVIWTLTVLMVIAASFSFSTKTAALSTFQIKEEAKAASLAEAGVEFGIMKLLHKKADPAALDAWKTDGSEYGHKMEGGGFGISVLDESGRVDINRSAPVILMTLMDSMGVQSGARDVIVDSIQDWKDGDNLHRLNGAEDEYYLSLPKPYRAKNANFDTVDELLLVRGVTEDILYGDSKRKGISEFLTVNAKDGRVNLNSAPGEVLLSVPGMTGEAADAIILRRQAAPLTDADIKSLAGEGFELMAGYITFSGGDIYSIESTGFTGQGRGYKIKTIVKIESADKYRFLYWSGRARL